MRSSRSRSATSRFSAAMSIAWSVSFDTATVSRCRRRMNIFWSEAPDAQAVSARQVGKRAVDVGAEAGGVAGAGMRRRQRVIDPALRQQPLAVPDAVVQIQHAELGVVPQRRVAGAGGDQVARHIGGVLVAAHAQPIHQQPVGGLVIRQAAPLDLVADDRAQHVHAAVDVAEHRARHGGDDRALRRLERIAGVLIDGAVLEPDGRPPVLMPHRKAKAGAHPHQMV